MSTDPHLELAAIECLKTAIKATVAGKGEGAVKVSFEDGRIAVYRFGESIVTVSDGPRFAGFSLAEWGVEPIPKMALADRPDYAAALAERLRSIDPKWTGTRPERDT